MVVRRPPAGKAENSTKPLGRSSSSCELLLHLVAHAQVGQRLQVRGLDLELDQHALAGLGPLRGQGGRILHRVQRTSAD